MRRLTILVAVLAALYSGYWFVGSRALDQAVVAQIATMRDDGWVVDYDALDVRGFPSRFDTKAAGLRVTTPDGKSRYATPLIEALALSYQPNAVILAFSDTHEISLEGVDFKSETEDMRASMKLKANAALALASVTAEAKSIALEAQTGDIWTATDLLAAMRSSGPLPHTYDLYANLDNIALPTRLLAQLNVDGFLPETISIANVDATVTLDRPLDRHTLPKWQEDPGRLRTLLVKSLVMSWGDFSLRAEGELAIDYSGTPEGTITITANDWQQMLDIGQSAGLIPAEFQFMARSMGQTLSGGAPDLVLPVTFMNGNLSVGPIPLGPAPSFF